MQISDAVLRAVPDAVSWSAGGLTLLAELTEPEWTTPPEFSPAVLQWPITTSPAGGACYRDA